MSQPGFYEDKRYCPRCAAHVPYLIALEATYCACCDQKVCLFSELDRREFARSLARAGAAEQEGFGSAFAAGERQLGVRAARLQEVESRPCRRMIF